MRIKITMAKFHLRAKQSRRENVKNILQCITSMIKGNQRVEDEAAKKILAKRPMRKKRWSSPSPLPLDLNKEDIYKENSPVFQHLLQETQSLLPSPKLTNMKSIVELLIWQLKTLKAQFKNHLKKITFLMNNKWIIDQNQTVMNSFERIWIFQTSK